MSNLLSYFAESGQIHPALTSHPALMIVVKWFKVADVLSTGCVNHTAESYSEILTVYNESITPNFICLIND